MERKTNTPKVNDICVLMLTRTIVKVIEIRDLTTSNIAICELLEPTVDEENGVPYREIQHFSLGELLTVNDLMKSWSDFMTFAAFAKNTAPQDEPLNHGLVWRFWNVGHTAYMHLLKWDVKQYL